MLMISLSSIKAQFNEDFNATADGALPTGWKAFNMDGLTPNSGVSWATNAWGCQTSTQILPTKAAWSTSWYTPAGTSNDWMFTPAILVPASNAYLRYTVSSYDATYADGYELRIMTTQPTSSNLMSSTVLLSVPAAAAIPTVKVIDLSAYAGQTVYIGWRNISTDKRILGIDDVSVRPMLNNDAAANVTMPSIVLVGNSNVTGSILNNGVNNITSFDVTYKVDGGASSSLFSVTGVNIASGTMKTFTHNVPANLGVGNRSIAITVSNINGGVDANIENNVATKIVSVPSQTVPKMCLFEGLTSSTCSPCATWNSTFNPWAATNDMNMNYIKYQTNWPGAGDPYSFSQTTDRVNYYDARNGGVPAMYANGIRMYPRNVSNLNAAVAKATSEIGVFHIHSTPSFVGNVITVPVIVNSYATIPGLSVRVAVCERKTTGNTGSNSETEFHHVLMQLLPTSAGTKVNFVDGSAFSDTFTKDMSTTHVEQMSDLIVVIFVQDDATKEIMQSKTFSVLPLSVENESMSNISIYPNPTKDNVRIKNATNSNILVFDILGKMVMSESNISNDFILNTSTLEMGNYVVKIMNGTQIVTRKITIIK